MGVQEILSINRSNNRKSKTTFLFQRWYATAFFSERSSGRAEL